MKVLHVAQTAQGGVGSYLEEIVAQHARQYGTRQVRAVVPDAHAALFPGLAHPWLVPFRNGRGRVSSTLRMAWVALREVRRWQPAIVHLHSTWAGLAMRPLLALLPGRRQVVYTPHAWAFDREGGRLQRAAIAWVERTLARLCDAVVCVSRFEAQRARAEGIAPRLLAVVHNGVSDVAADPSGVEAAAREWPDGCLRVLFVGRFDRQKGVDVFCQALAALGDKAFGVVVGSAVVGDRAPARLPANARALGWRSRAQTASLYAAADVLAVPSRWEAFPLVVLEAMRAGLPVVASRVGGIPEALEDGVTGRLVDADAPAQLAAALGTLDPATLEAMRGNARRRYLEAFRIERVVRELDAVYRQLEAQEAQR